MKGFSADRYWYCSYVRGDSHDAYRKELNAEKLSRTVSNQNVEGFGDYGKDWNVGIFYPSSTFDFIVSATRNIDRYFQICFTL